MNPELIGLSGGRKRLWLNNHRDEILEYYAQHGLYGTMREFNLGFDTFQNFIRQFLNENGKSKTIDTSSVKIENRLKYVEDSIREMGIQQRRLIGDFQRFVPSVAESIAQKYIIPGIVNGLMNTIEDKSDALPEKNHLEIKD